MSPMARLYPVPDQLLLRAVPGRVSGVVYPGWQAGPYRGMIGQGQYMGRARASIGVETGPV